MERKILFSDFYKVASPFPFWENKPYISPFSENPRLQGFPKNKDSPKIKLTLLFHLIGDPPCKIT